MKTAVVVAWATFTLSGLAAASEPASVPETPPLFDGLGTHTRRISTRSLETQRYFDQGLAFLYAFNHDEAMRAFRRAAELDPACAATHWGLALAQGPHINNTSVPPERERAAVEALQLAGAARQASTVERALISALRARHAQPAPADRKPLDWAYADAMRAVWKAHPRDADVGALFAEALADLRPWDLWTSEGQPQPGTDELLATLDAVLALDPRHPLANHLYIHAVEASPRPEKADRAADVLRDLQPGLGHLVHMPSHVDVRRGRWEQAIAANAKAVDADRGYVARAGRQGFYRIYMAHNRHMLAYAAMMTGRSREALLSIRALVAEMPADWLTENAAFADGFLAMPIEVLMRFGRWDEILAEPEPAAALAVPITRALRRYARGVALAAKGDVDGARAEQRAFAEARAQVPQGAFFGNNAAADILAVAEALLRGEVLYRAGEVDAGLAALRDAQGLEDKLRYNEPPDWIQPVRHALGAALLQSARLAEAEAVLREDLRRLPENGWGLFGLARALRLQKRDVEAAEVEARFERIWAQADFKLTSPCLCQPGV